MINMKYLLIFLILPLNIYAQALKADLNISKDKSVKIQFFTDSIDKIESGHVLIGKDKFIFEPGNNIDHVAYLITPEGAEGGGMIFFLKRYSKHKEINLKVQTIRLALTTNDEKVLKEKFPPINNIKFLNCNSESEIFILYGIDQKKESFANCLSNIQKN